MSGPTTTDASEPILASWKISDVLHHYPALLDTLVALDPAFGALRNPLRRRVQSRLVTVAQAAAIAGMEPTALVHALNAAVGLAEPAAAPQSAAPASPAAPPAWVGTATVAVEFDARPLLARGEEPFSAIMQAAGPVPEGQILRVYAPFDPIPLYDVFARRGFTGWARQIGPDDWEVSFLNEGRPAHAPHAAAAPPAASAWETPTAEVTIDVSELVPPEPMIKILQTLEELPPGGTLRVHHVRRPIHLYPRLDELGCRHETREPEPGKVEVLIQKPAAAPETGA